MVNQVKLAVFKLTEAGLRSKQNHNSTYTAIKIVKLTKCLKNSYILNCNFLASASQLIQSQFHPSNMIIPAGASQISGFHVKTNTILTNPNSRSHISSTHNSAHTVKPAFIANPTNQRPPTHLIRPGLPPTVSTNGFQYGQRPPHYRPDSLNKRFVIFPIKIATAEG